MNKQELRQWIIEFAKVPAYFEVIEAIDNRIESVISAAIAEHEAGKWQSFGKKIPYGYAKIMVIFPPEAKQEANIVTYDPDADDYQDGDIWAYVTDLSPKLYQKGGEG